jgi:hypothetical protein
LLEEFTDVVAFVKLPTDAVVAFVKLPTDAVVAFVKLPTDAVVAFVKLTEAGNANVILVVRFAKGNSILEEFIVPSIKLPSMTPEGSVEFNNETRICPFSVESPLYRNAPVTLSRDVTFI